MKDIRINKEMVLQITIKIINDTAEPDGIMSILLVFEVYSRILVYWIQISNRHSFYMNREIDSRSFY